MCVHTYRRENAEKRCQLCIPGDAQGREKKKLLGSNRLKERCSREGRPLMFEWEREDLEKQGERRSREASILWCQVWDLGSEKKLCRKGRGEAHLTSGMKE